MRARMARQVYDLIPENERALFSSYESRDVQLKERIYKLLNSRIDGETIDLPAFDKIPDSYFYDQVFEKYQLGDGDDCYLPSLEKGMALLDGEVQVESLWLPDIFRNERNELKGDYKEMLSALKPGEFFRMYGLDLAYGKALRFMEELAKDFLEDDPDVEECYPMLLFMKSDLLGAFYAADLPKADKDVEAVHSLIRELAPFKSSTYADAGVSDKCWCYGVVFGQIDGYSESYLNEISMTFYPVCVMLKEKLDHLNKRYPFYKKEECHADERTD